LQKQVLKVRPNTIASVSNSLLVRGRRRRLLIVEVLLHTLLVLGDHVGNFGFLIGVEQLINLGSDFGVLDFHRHVCLGFLIGDCRGLRLIEVAAGHELDHGHSSLHFLLHQRLHGRLFVLENLFDLSLLILAEIQLMQEHPEFRAAHAHKVAVHSLVPGAGATSAFLGERRSGDKRQRERRDKCKHCEFWFHGFLLN
jgi:hypothetical protein